MFPFSHFGQIKSLDLFLITNSTLKFPFRINLPSNTSLLTLNTVQSIMNGDYQAAAGWCAGTLYANFLMGSIASQVAISGQERAYDIDRINFEHQGFSIDMY